MANRKNKKRQHSRTVELKRQVEQEQLADEKSRAKNRWNPAGRALLYGDLVFLAVCLLLESQELIPETVSNICTVIGVVLMLAALWLLFGPQKDRGFTKGPRL